MPAEYRMKDIVVTKKGLLKFAIAVAITTGVGVGVQKVFGWDLLTGIAVAVTIFVLLWIFSGQASKNLRKTELENQRKQQASQMLARAS